MKRKTAFVTGASRGIGKFIALKFAKEGFNLVINCATNKNDLLQTKTEIENYNVECLALVGNIGSYEEANKIIIAAKHQFQNIDVLVNNAGISYIGLLSDMSPEEWHNVITTNLTSVFNCCNLIVPDMIKNKYGKIINISSVWGVVGASCEVAYSASKGGMNSFTKALAKELAPSNIQVNAIALGAIDTQMNYFLSEEDRNSLIDEIPANRLGLTEDVADFVYQIASSNDYLTGQVIQFDGGWI